MRFLLVTVLALLCSTLGTAAERLVPAQHATIQAAISAATPGDIIRIAAGTYVENLNVDKYLILEGVGQSLTDTVIQGQVTITGSGLSAAFPLEIRDLRIQPIATGAGVFFSTAVSDIFLRDITSTTAAGNSGHYAIHVQGGSDITNLRLEGVTASYSLGAFRVATTGIVDGLSIRNCDFSDNVNGMLVYASNGTPDSGPTFNNVHIYKTRFFGNKQKGIYSEKFNNTTISQCTFESNGVDVGHWSPYVDGGSPFSAGFDLNLKFGDFSNFRLVGNHFLTNGAAADPDKGAAVLIKARDDGGTYGGHPATLAGIEVSGNTFVNNSYMDLRFGEPTKLNAGMSGAVVRNNSFVGSIQNIGVDNHATLPIDARHNYWNAVDGSSANGGSGAGVNVFAGAGAVDSTNHLAVVDDNALVLGFQQMRYVDDDWAAIAAGLDPDGAGPAIAMGADAFATIADAVNAASPGDRILVMNGTYLHSQVLVDVDVLTIEGESRAGVRIVPSQVDTKGFDAATGTANYALTIGADDVTISNLTIDGEGNNIALGQAAMDNNFRVGVMSDLNNLWMGTTLQSLDVSGVVFAGIRLGGFDETIGRSSGNLVDDCSVSDVSYQAGIMVSGGSTISDNTIDSVGLVSTPGGLIGHGILVDCGPSTISGNIISNFSKHGIANDSTTFSGNNVYVVQGNTISQILDGNGIDGEIGIRIVGADGDSKIGGSGTGEGNSIDLTGNDESRQRIGIYMTFMGDDELGDPEITGNSITLAGDGTGIVVQTYARPGQPMRIHDNTLTSSNPTASDAFTGSGILLADSGDILYVGHTGTSDLDVELRGNNISGFVVGIYARDSEDAHLGITLNWGNTLTGNTVGMLLEDAGGFGGANRVTVMANDGGVIAQNNAEGIWIQGASFQGSEVESSGNTGFGVRVFANGRIVSITDSVLSGNATGVSIDAAAQAVGALTGNDFTGNTTSGLNNLLGVVVDATNSFWGDVSGPTHATNVAGTGVVVSNNVTFVPFIGFDPIEPTFTNNPPTMVDVLQPYSHTIMFTGNPVPTLMVSGLPAWLVHDGNGNLSGTPGLADAGISAPITFRAESNFGPDAEQVFTIEVVATAPMITSTPATTISIGSPYSYVITGTGVPSATFTVMNLPAWLSFDNVNTISGTPSLGDLGQSGMITVTASNGVGVNATQNFQVQVAGVAPGITSAPLTTIVIGQPYVYTITATGTPAPTFSVMGLPVWLTFDNVNRISGTPALGDFGMSGMITFTAANGVGADATQAFQINVAGTAPQITSIPSSIAEAGSPYIYTIVATGTPTPTITVGALPAWLTFDNVNRLSGTPSVADSGNDVTITVTANNGVSAPVLQTYALSVQAIAPKITTMPDQVAVVGQLFTYSVIASGVPTPTVSVVGLPAWLTFDNVNTISGVPPASARGFTGYMTLTLSNGVDPDVMQVFRLQVYDPAFVPESASSGCALAGQRQGAPVVLLLVALTIFVAIRRRRQLAPLYASD